MPRRLVYRVVLQFRLGITHSVFIKAKTRHEAEQIALARYPDAVQVHRPFYPPLT